MSAPVTHFQFKMLSHQMRFVSSKARFCINSGGVGSGKTVGLAVKAIKTIAENPGILGLIGAQTVPVIRNTIQREFLKVSHQGCTS